MWVLFIRCNATVRTACEHLVHVQIGKICFRDAIGPTASLRYYCTKEICNLLTQSNNQWSGGIAAHSAPKNSECKTPMGKFSPRLFGIKTAFSSLIIFQRAKISTRSISQLCWNNWRTFWRKNAAEISPRVSCSCTTMPRLTRHLQHRRNWPTWTSSVLITHSILQIWSHRTTTSSLDWIKTIESSPVFLRRGGHCCRGDLVGRTIFWFFFEWLAKVRAKG